MEVRRQLMQYLDLPPIFRKVDYLQGQGGQYIDTGVVARSGLIAKYEIEFTRTDVIQQVCAAINANDAYSQPRLYFPYSDGNSWRFAHGFQAVTISGISVTANVRYIVEATMMSGTQKVIINNNTYYTGSATTSINVDKPLFLFASNNSTVSSRRYAYAKIYSFSLQDAVTGNTLANYIPCVRNDNKPGMYDTITKSFYTNMGTGEFIIP